MKPNNETFKMYCKCGKAFVVPAYDPDPRCKKCNEGLDFEPKKVEK